jgi:hypothetical protein
MSLELMINHEDFDAHTITSFELRKTIGPSVNKNAESELLEKHV